MIRLYILNEGTLLSLVWHAWRGADVRILEVAPFMGRLRPILMRIADRLTRAGRARWLFQTCPEFARIREHRPRTHIYDILADVEPWLAKFHRFGERDSLIAGNERIVRQICLHSFARQQANIIGIAEAGAMIGPENISLHGVFGSLAGTVAAWRPQDCPMRINVLRLPHRLINLCMAFFFSVFTLGWIASRIKFRAPEPEEFMLAADDIGDPTDLDLFRELPELYPILVVIRHPEFRISADADTHNQFVFCRPTDGFFTLKMAWNVARLSMTMMFVLTRQLSWMEFPLFAAIAKIPYRHVLYRALFSRYRPKVFWGRDPYNIDHIVRRRELRRFGAESWGVMHSYLAYGTTYPEFRYIDFDRFFVMGLGFCERYQSDSWPTGMKLISASTFRATRAQFARRLLSKPSDILVMCSVYVGDQGMVDLTRGLAEAFPDRTVYLQIKSNRRGEDSTEGFITACTNGIMNITVTHEAPYQLFTKARYAFSDPSGVLIEALQFGLYSFFADLVPQLKESIYQKFPGFSITSAQQAIVNVRRIEDGTWDYPAISYENLVDLTGRVFFDAMRENLGLRPSEVPQRIWPIQNYSNGDRVAIRS